MPESSKTTLTELSARYFVGGDAAVKQRYPNTNHFLVVIPKSQNVLGIAWTPHKIHESHGTTRVSFNKHQNFSTYAIPTALVVPIEKVRNPQKDITMGRFVDCDVRLHCPSVSKVHAFFSEAAHGVLRVRDNNSKNGTRLNDLKLTESFSYYQLNVGNELQFGNVRTVYVDYENLLVLIAMVPTD